MLSVRYLTTVCLISCLVIFLISFGMAQYIKTTYNSEQSFGLFGANIMGIYKSYSSWRTLCDDCTFLEGFYNAGSASAAFQVLAFVVLLLAIVLNVLEIFRIKIFNSSVFDGHFVTYLSFGVSLILTFSWILWTIIRPFNPFFYYGFSYNGLLVSIALAALAGVFSIYDQGKSGNNNSKSGYVSIDENNEDISYGEIPEGQFSLRKLILFTSWQSPITVRILYYLAMVLAICNFISSMVNLSDLVGLAGFFRTLLRELIYNIAFIGIVRVLGELAMKVFEKYNISNHGNHHSQKKIEVIFEKQEDNKEDVNQTDNEYNNDDLLNTDNESTNPNFDDDNKQNNNYQEIN